MMKRLWDGLRSVYGRRTGESRYVRSAGAYAFPKDKSTHPFPIAVRIVVSASLSAQAHNHEEQQVKLSDMGDGYLLRGYAPEGACLFEFPQGFHHKPETRLAFGTQDSHGFEGER